MSRQRSSKAALLAVLLLTTSSYVMGADFTDIAPVGGNEPVKLNLSGVHTFDAVTIEGIPTTGTAYSIPKGIIVRGDSNVTINGPTSVKLALANEKPTTGAAADSIATYGITTGYNHNGGPSTATAQLTMNGPVSIDITNTANTIVPKITRRFGPAFFPISVSIDSGHQLSGIRVFRTNGAKPIFTANGDVNVNIHDTSTAIASDYNVGLYVSGNESEAIFNGNTNITVESEARDLKDPNNANEPSIMNNNSAGIKIGKPGDQDITSVSATFNGKLKVDTTNSPHAGAVRLFGNGAKFYVTGANTSEASEIQSADKAIVFDTQDYKTKGLAIDIPGTPSRNANNSNNIVDLTNTRLSTTSTTASLIQAKAENVDDILVDTAKHIGISVPGNLNTGVFNTTNANFTLRGEKSLATAASDGWLIEVQEAERDTIKYSSSLEAQLTDKAQAVGLVHKEGASTLNLIVDEGATWTLAPKATIANDEQRATVSNLTIGADSTLDATNPTNAQEATYFVKATSNGVDADGTIINAGTINLANTSYRDALTLEGNYIGNNGRVRLNTLWNSPGDDVDGTDSISDLLTITGTATGTTQVVSVGVDGRESIIDGTIGSIAGDLNAKSTPVVRVQGAADANTFQGTAKTTGAGELQLATRLNANNEREFFWTVMAVNPVDPVVPVDPINPVDPVNPIDPISPIKPINPIKPPTPIMDKTVPGYVQMARVNAHMGLSTLSTLHERRGENQLIKWDHRQSLEADEDQIWARLIRNHAEVEGENRFNYDLDVSGVQIGNDFKISYDDKGGYRMTGAYFSYLRGKSKFYDQLSAANGILIGTQYTGSGRTDQYALGVTSTKYKANGSYLDLVGQVSYSDNEYSAVNGIQAKNHGWGLALSAEVGRPYVIKEREKRQWIIEPQAQLIYINQGLSSFNDGIRSVSQDNYNSLRARIGARIAYNRFQENSQEKTRTFYGIVNIWRDFNSNVGANIGRDYVSERYNNFIGEIGIGAQYAFNKDTYFYTDVRFEHNLGGEDYHGYRANLGLKHTF